MEPMVQRFRMADRFEFRVQGSGLPSFFSAAAAKGVRLRHIAACGPQRYGASAWGRDWPVLCALAERGGWKLELVRRRGPGCLMLRLARRAGVPAGAVLFLLLMHGFSGVIWKIDYEGMERDQQAGAAAILQECGVFEGVQADEARLKQAQDALLNHSEEFGWVSLNFTGGCLFLESTEAQRSQVEETQQEMALYAKADAYVTAVEVESGFAAVKPGQTVAEGQVLANDFRLDRSEQPVRQTASGRVMGRVTKQYEAVCPLRTEADCLTGRRTERQRVLVFGREVWAEEAAPPFKNSIAEEECRPLELLGLALPACVQVQRRWETVRLPLERSAGQAAALTLRECWKNLYQAFPDAAVEASEVQQEMGAQGAVCRLRVTFVADIARLGSAGEPPAGE